MQLNQKGSVHIAVFLIFFLVIVSAFLFTSTASASKKPNPSPTPVVTPSPTPSPNPCANPIGSTQVKLPNGGEVYQLGDDLKIDWCINNLNEQNIYDDLIWLSERITNPNGTFTYTNKVQIAEDIHMTYGFNTLTWQIPSTVIPGSNYVILVGENVNLQSRDYSDGVFTINP